MFAVGQGNFLFLAYLAKRSLDTRLPFIFHDLLNALVFELLSSFKRNFLVEHVEEVFVKEHGTAKTPLKY
jgi:hypothetical protein